MTREAKTLPTELPPLKVYPFPLKVTKLLYMAKLHVTLCDCLSYLKHTSWQVFFWHCLLYCPCTEYIIEPMLWHHTSGIYQFLLKIYLFMQEVPMKCPESGLIIKTPNLIMKLWIWRFFSRKLEDFQNSLWNSSAWTVCHFIPNVYVTLKMCFRNTLTINLHDIFFLSLLILSKTVDDWMYYSIENNKTENIWLQFIFSILSLFHAVCKTTSQ